MNDATVQYQVLKEQVDAMIEGRRPMEQEVVDKYLRVCKKMHSQPAQTQSIPKTRTHIDDVAPEVAKFIERCSSLVDGFEQVSFDLNHSIRYSQDKTITSPIEQLVEIAFDTMSHLNYFDEWDDTTRPPSKPLFLGLGLLPQYQIGPYRVDFLGIYRESEKADTTQLIVECDSQQFHENTEEERRYEKERDRYLQAKGYKVFHYTGKQIMQDPFKVAGEIIAHLTGRAIEDLRGGMVNYE